MIHCFLDDLQPSNGIAEGYQVDFGGLAGQCQAVWRRLANISLIVQSARYQAGC